MACCLVFSSNIAFGQVMNTVGVITYNNPTEGYNLVYPHNQSDVFLLNNCGEIAHIWPDDERFTPGNISYLTEDGLS